MRLFISKILAVVTIFTPSLVLAQTTDLIAPLPAVPGTHPDAVPPTKAPTELLPPAPLLKEEAQALVPSPTEESATSQAAALSEGIFMRAVIIGGPVLLAIGIGWWFIRRRGRTVG